MIEITHRWGLAKRGTWEEKGEEITLPAVLGWGEDRVGPFRISRSFFDEVEVDIPATFSYPEYIGGALVEAKGHGDVIQTVFDQEPDPDIEIYVIGNAPELVGRADLLVDKINNIRKKIAPHKLVYAPGVAAPQNLALLVYMGIDIFDTLYCEYMASHGAELSNWMGFPGDPSINERKLREELGLVRKAIEYGRIRELVESRVSAEPWMVEALRRLDERYDLVSPGVPVDGGPIYACTRGSLSRPDIVRFQKRLSERYIPPERDVLLLLPCSSSKPYFNSRTHRIIRDSMKGTDWTRVHEVILTSPMGAVPRELELFYPAQNYDIPVSHRWFEDEKKMIVEAVDKMISKGGYTDVVSHLPANMDYIPEHLDCFDTTHGDHPTDEGALGRLNDRLMELVGRYRGDVKRYLKENVTCLARFQFGPGADALLDGSIVKGRYPNYRIMCEGTQRGMIVSQRGMIALTIDGGEILNDEGTYQVEIDDFRPKGTVFAVGVKDAYEHIHPGDECVLSNEGKLKGVGKAVMSGPEMMRAERGGAVEVRHYV